MPNIAKSGQQVCQNHEHKNITLHKFATCNLKVKESPFSDIHYITPDIQTEFEINRLVSHSATEHQSYLY